MKKKGIFITFEGNEGSGKTTQTKLIYRYLRAKRRGVFLTREPGGTRVGDAVRGVLLDNKNKRMSPVCETLLYMASRAQLVEDEIAPRLRAGEWVLCDRWLDATVAYQGYGSGVDVKWIRDVASVATKGLKPDLTLFLDLKLETGLRRARQRKKADRVERKSLAFHQKVRRGYEKIAKAEPRRFKWISIGPDDSVLEVYQRIVRVIEHALR